MLGDDADVAGLYTAFGESVTFDLTPNLTITAIFQDGTDAVSMPGYDVEAAKPSLTCRTVQLTSAVKEKVKVTVRATVYTIERKHKTGVGETVLYLKT
jgi:hypothetical protein